MSAPALLLLAEPSPPSSFPTLVGAAGSCADQLDALARELGAQEMMLLDFLQRDQDARLAMYRALAGAACLSGIGAHVA